MYTVMIYTFCNPTIHFHVSVIMRAVSHFPEISHECSCLQPAEKKRERHTERERVCVAERMVKRDRQRQREREIE